MNRDEAEILSLLKLMREIVPQSDCTSVDNCWSVLDNFESNIEDLEFRVARVREEVEILIAQK